MRIIITLLLVNVKIEDEISETILKIFKEGAIMFLGFKIEDFKVEDIITSREYYFDKGTEMYNDNFETINKHLDDYLFEGTDVINADEIDKDWFPKFNIDVFLSHSHQDEEKAKIFAGWLNDKFGLKVFNDSCVWRSADDLLMKIDTHYCKFPETETFNYQKRNYSTSHVHMMLSMALTKMMDRSEVVIFMNTENSVQKISETIENTVKSPWIYSELVMTNLIRKRLPEREMIKKARKETLSETRELKIARDVSIYLEQLLLLNKERLVNWEKDYNEQTIISSIYALDFLYLQYEELSTIISKL